MTLRSGTQLGPYEVVDLLGAGGMGEVYRARDARLGREVAVKVLPAEVAGDPGRQSLFEREARAVAALNHPNILTLHDVGAHDGVPYVVTELLEGETLRELASRRAPALQQVLSYMLQAARGLEAAHAKNIVHRDLKPDNLFLTTEGRVKVLDFGLAKAVHLELEVGSEVSTSARFSAPGQVAGTVLYMSPEQARGQPVDARTDVFSFGVVLYELVAGRHPFRKDTVASTLTAILDETPLDLETLGRGVPPAVAGIVRRCLEKPRGERYASGHEVAVALETVLAAPSGAAALRAVEERSPYPGLSSFTEKDAAHFFGREDEAAALWQRLQQRRLLALIGPSGAGKTSFVRAGVLPARPSGWTVVVSTPGRSPMRALGRALAPELAADTEALSALVDFEEPDAAVSLLARWRKPHVAALVVLDQFEELFTLNPPEVQGRFAAFLARLGSEADVHVLLSLRDDFLMKCYDHAPLAPVFSELTPLGPLTREGLRRAVTEPARKQGYRFEDEALVDEMLDAVEGARSALPLLAFAVSRLWEKRDLDERLLTRAAYEEIGGVAGALAQHAEQTLERIGTARHAMVRDIFRNLVTSQGTRASSEREELLSVFPERGTADQVLGELIDARLLTSYEISEVPGGEDAGQAASPSRHRIEIVHESLLKAWPRLVWWQSQDEEGAHLRDQIKQAAHLWEEKDRSPDLLWSGTAFHEFELWRGRYPGQLTAVEEDFARSMAARAQRRTRLRTAAVASVILVLAGVAIVIGASRHEALESARRAEASKLVALAETRLEEDPTEALALATASLELADTLETRVFVTRALSEAPPAREAEAPGGAYSAFSLAFPPDGRQLAVGGLTAELPVWAEDGSGPLLLPGQGRGAVTKARWSSTGFLVTGLMGLARSVDVWAFPGGRRTRTIEFGHDSSWQVGPRHLFAQTIEPDTAGRRGVHTLRSWRLPDGEPELIGRVDWATLGASRSLFVPNGRAWLYSSGRSVYRRALPLAEGDAGRLLTRHEAEVLWLDAPAGHGDRIGALDAAGGIRVWSFAGSTPELLRSIPGSEGAPQVTSLGPVGRWLAGLDGHQVHLRSVDAWPDARPLTLKRSGSWREVGYTFHPRGDWFVATTRQSSRLTFWPVRRAFPVVMDGYTGTRPLAFSRDGAWLATSWSDGLPRLWPLPGAGSREIRVLDFPEPPQPRDLAFAPDDRFLFGAGIGPPFIAPLDGSPVRLLQKPSPDRVMAGVAVSPSGRRFATGSFFGEGPERLLVRHLGTGKRRLFDLPRGPVDEEGRVAGPSWLAGSPGAVTSLHFADEATLYTAGMGGVRRWDVESGAQKLVFATQPGVRVLMKAAHEGRRALVELLRTDAERCEGFGILDLDLGTMSRPPWFEDCPASFAFDPSGTVAATGDFQGIVRVGRLPEEEPHLLFGHEGAVRSVALSHDLRWIASAGEDETLRLWPMPDLDDPPLHTLPHDELLARLRSLTNLRAVEDPESETGWTIELDAFPGWRDVPDW